MTSWRPSTRNHIRFRQYGKRLAFAGNGKGGSYDIFTAPIESDSGNVRLGKPELGRWQIWTSWSAAAG
jgi:hypothetical protein